LNYTLLYAIITVQIRGKGGQNMKRSFFIRLFSAITVMSCLFLFLALSFSHGIEHNCMGEDCLICLFISASERLSAVALTVTQAFSAGLVIFLASLTDRSGAPACQPTLVSLKVKLSD
jgi:hypothetical protein